MKKFFKTIISEIMLSHQIKFSLQEILSDNTTRVIGFISLNLAPEKGSFMLFERTNVNGEKYFKKYIIQNTSIVGYENGKKEGFIYLKFLGIQKV